MTCVITAGGNSEQGLAIRPTVVERLVAERTAVQPCPEGIAFSAEAEALFAAMTVEPDNDRKALIDATIAALIAGGVWAKYQEIYLYAGHTLQASLLNWKNPAQSASRTDNCPHTVDRGFTGNQTRARGIQSATDWASGSITASSAHWSFYVNANFGGDSNNIEGGAGFNTGGIFLANGNISWNIQQGGSPEGFLNPAGTAQGSWIATTNGTTDTLYRQAGSIRTRAAGGAHYTFGSKYAWLGDANVSAAVVQSNRRLAYGTFGTFLSAAEVSAMHTALLAYLTAIGAN